jgi:hypothetical protein
MNNTDHQASTPFIADSRGRRHLSALSSKLPVGRDGSRSISRDMEYRSRGSICPARCLKLPGKIAPASIRYVGRALICVHLYFPFPDGTFTVQALFGNFEGAPLMSASSEMIWISSV